MPRNVIAMYPDLQTAERVVQDLLDANVDRNRISVVSHDASQKYRDMTTMSDDRRTENAAKGAGGGALAGALGGALLAVGLAAIPGVGWIIGAGPVAAILGTGAIGAAVGAAAGGLGGALSQAGVPEGRAHQYAEGIRRGGALVAVEVEDRLSDRTIQLMERHNPVDIDRSAKRWRDQEGWTAYDAKSKPFTDQQAHSERTHWNREATTGHVEQSRTTESGKSIPVVEEQVSVGKRDVVTGGARVHTYPIEKPIHEDVRLREEHVDVKRQRVNRPIDSKDANRAFEDRTIEVTEHGEEPVVRKEARVVEEISIEKRTGQRTQGVDATERHTGVEVEDLHPNQRAKAGSSGLRDTGSSRTSGTTGSTFAGTTGTSGITGSTDPYYRSHFDQNYRGQDWDTYSPAYELGAQMARKEGTGISGSRRSWREVETEARSEWERSPRSLPFDRVRAAIQHGYEEELRGGTLGTPTR